ncbi:MAG: ABC transporter ATP-binding protein [Anaerolineae bacterium]|jgi:ABC-2 type transport system ATP-binding protein|nr:ABC transporter ATP-binding protein [Anaerolineae bacterium]MBT7073224.1 ABC transporter ATP-binding protein [Anaerolineae bacterium]MBT7326083.1 ABC transporter ATP-binding protein [Anaerolineae bacterium]
MNHSVIRVEKLTRRFGENIAVNDLSLEVQAGEVFGFLGHNGAGKTTTVRLLNGVLEAHSGSMRVLDLDPLNDGPSLRARTGVLTESASVENRLTARDNLLIYADLFSLPHEKISARVSELLDFFGLSKYADEKMEAFSTGMRQRLALARTLLHDPEVLFLDEPTAGLDPVAANQVNELIANLSEEKGRTVFLCTHNLVEAQKLCDRVAVMEHGKLAAIGTPKDLMQQYVRRLDVDIEVSPEQVDVALNALSSASPLTQGLPRHVNGNLTLTIPSRDVIPALVSLLVKKGIRVYHIAAHQPSLEDVYFALHGEKEAVQ